MSEYGEELSSRIRAAMRSAEPDAIVSGVKDAVTDEVLNLSPDIKVVRTEYFNHSYMPDLMLEWTDLGRRNERPIFLRNSLRPSVQQEVENLADRGPVVLSLTPPEPEARAENSLRDRARRENRVLVTDVSSLSDVSNPTIDSTANAPRLRPPLLQLVQTNLLKGGRGLLTPVDAERIRVSASPADPNEELNADFLSSFNDFADDLFTPDAALRLRRAAELLQFGLAADQVNEFPEAGGRFSDIDLRVLVPHLLSDETAARRTALWAYIGSMMSLEQLEDMSDALEGFDVSPLVRPNADIWRTARRAQLVLNSDFDPEEELPNESSTDPGQTDLVWTVRNRMLASKSGRWRLFVTTDARRLKGRTDGLTARWDDLAPSLQAFALAAVDLRGVSRTISVSAERSDNVLQDVQLIRENILDSFQVTNVSVRPLQETEPGPAVNIDFIEMTASADKTSLSSMVVAAALLGYRDLADFSPLIGTI